MTPQEIQFLFKMRDQMSAQLRALNSVLKAGGAEADKLSGKFDNIAKSAEAAGAAIAGAFAIRAYVSGTLGAFGDLEQKLIAVRKTADLSKQDMEAFKDEIKTLGSTIRGVSNRNLLEIAEVAGQMGIKGVANITKFTETIAKLQTAAPSLVGGDGATIIARILTLTKEGIPGIGRLSNALVELGNNSAASEQEILGAASAVSQSAAAFKLGSAAILGMSAAAKELNFRDEIFGAAIGRTLVSLQEAAISGSRGMSVLTNATGTTREEFKKLIETKPEEAIYEFLRVLQSIDSDTSRQSFLEQFGLQAEENQRVMGALSQNIDVYRTKIDMASAAAAKGTALNKEYTTGAEAFNAMLTNLGNNFENFRTTVGEALAPIGTFIGETLITAFKTLDSAFRAIPKGLQTAIAGFVGFVLVAGTLVKTFAVLKGAFALLRIGAFASQLGIAAGAVAALGSAGTALAVVLGATVLGVALDTGIDKLATWLSSIESVRDGVRSFIGDGALRTFLDMLNSDVTTGIVQRGPNAGKDFWTREAPIPEDGRAQMDKYANTRTQAAKFQQDINKKKGRLQAGPEINYIPPLSDADRQSLSELDTVTQAMQAIGKYETALNNLRKLSEKGGFKPKEGLDITTQDEIKRLEKLIEVRKRMADPVAQQSRVLSDQLEDTNATTGALQDQVELSRTLRDLTEERGVITKEQTAEITKQIAALQQARGLAFYKDQSTELTNQMALFNERNSLSAIELSRQQQITQLLREQSGLTKEQATDIANANALLAKAALQRSTMDQLDPIAAANVEYQNQLKILQSINGLTDQQRAAMKANLDLQTLSSRDPIGARVKEMQDELATGKMATDQAAVEKQVIAEVNQLRQQGVTVTTAQTQAIRDYATAMAEVDRLSKNGFGGFINEVGTVRDQLLTLQKSFADGLSDAIVDGLAGSETSFADLAKNLGKQFLSAGVKGLMAQALTKMGANDDRDAAVDAASAAANKLKNLADQGIVTNQVMLTSGSVFINGQPVSATSGTAGLTPANTNTPADPNWKGWPIIPVEKRALGAPGTTPTPRSDASLMTDADRMPAAAAALNLPAPSGNKDWLNQMYAKARAAGMEDAQARLTASQAALESNYGKSGLATKGNNLFGIKAGRGYQGETIGMRTREENAAGNSYYETAQFRKYGDAGQSLADHQAMLARRWPEAANANTFQGAAAGLRTGQQGGYATDQNYVSKISSINSQINPAAYQQAQTGIQAINQQFGQAGTVLSDAANSAQLATTATQGVATAQTALASAGGQAAPQVQQAAQALQQAGQAAAQGGQAASTAAPAVNNFSAAAADVKQPLAAAETGFAGLGQGLMGIFKGAAGGMGAGANVLMTLLGGFLGFADGGKINGKGTGRSDSILARVSNGEFIMNAKSTKAYEPLLHAMNDNSMPNLKSLAAFADGGPVGRVRNNVMSSSAMGERSVRQPSANAGTRSGTVRNESYFAPTIPISVTASGNKETDEQMTQRMAQEVDTLLDTKMNEFVAKQQRSGGTLNSKRFV